MHLLDFITSTVLYNMHNNITRISPKANNIQMQIGHANNSLIQKFQALSLKQKIKDKITVFCYTGYWVKKKKLKIISKDKEKIHL